MPKKTMSNEQSSSKQESQTQQVKTNPIPYRIEKIGTIAVDTGRLVILDPCRIDEVMEHLDEPINLGKQLGEFVVGSETGLGDGRYPVFAEIVNHESLGERVVALHVHLDPMYCFADDPKVAVHIKESESQYLSEMNDGRQGQD